MRVISSLRFAALFALLGFAACSGGGDGSSDGAKPIAAPYEFLISGAPVSTDDNGQATITFTLPAGIAAFQVATFDDTFPIQTLSVKGPDGTLLFSSKASSGGEVRGPGAPHYGLTTFNYPYLPSHSAPRAGTYQATVRLFGNVAFTRGREVRASIVTKRDSNLGSGSLQVNLIYAGLIADSDESRKAIQNSIPELRDTFGRANISLNISEFERKELPSVLPNPALGNAIYEQLANELPHGVNIVFGVDVSSIGGTDSYFSQVGSVPGSFVPSRSSAIAVSLSRLAGRDGEFDSKLDKRDQRYSEIQLLSEAVAHDLGHYLGLLNTVDFLGSSGYAIDGLDTPKCFSEDNCVRDRGAAENLMFTLYLEDIFDRTREFISRYRIEPSQAKVLNASVGVN